MKIATLALALIVTAAPLAAQTPDRDATRAARFEALNGAPQPGHSTRVELATALRALAEVSRSFDHGGTGDAEFWMKCTRDFVRSGRGVGRAMQTLARSMGPGPVSAAIGGVGASLATLSDGGTGDAHYWMARTKEVSTRIRATGEQLDTIAASLAAGPAAETVPLAALLDGFAEVAFTLDQGGHGDAEYWMRTTRNFAHVGRGIGRGVSVAAAGTPEPLNSVLRSMAAQLAALNEGGTGSSQYWMARARGIAEQVRGTGTALREMAYSLP
jgi:hypothetical protein